MKVKSNGFHIEYGTNKYDCDKYRNFFFVILVFIYHNIIISSLSVLNFSCGTVYNCPSNRGYQGQSLVIFYSKKTNWYRNSVMNISKKKVQQFLAIENFLHHQGRGHGRKYCWVLNKIGCCWFFLYFKWKGTLLVEERSVRVYTLQTMWYIMQFTTI